MSRRILVFGSVPLAAPWNGADKNLARLLVQHDQSNQYIVQTSRQEVWPATVQAVRSRYEQAMPTVDQKLRAFGFLMRYTSQAELIHIIASLQAPSRWSGPLVRLIPTLQRKPIIHTVPSIGEQPIQRRNFPGDVTVVVSEHTQRKLIAHGMPNVVQVFPPLDLQRFRPRTSPQTLAAQLQLGERAVLYPAHYGPQSGIYEMIQSFSGLPAALDDAVLVLACRTHAGQDPVEEANRVMAQATAAGIAERVRILGNVYDMPALISACVVTALVPGKLESKMDLPLAILESLALGRAVIISDRPPMNEALLGGGLAVPYQEIPALTDALVKLLGDANVRDKFATQGQQMVSKLCEPSQFIASYQEIYQGAFLARGSSDLIKEKQ